MKRLAFISLALGAVSAHAQISPGTGTGATIASTTNVIKGDNAGNGVAAVPGTDYVLPDGTATQLNSLVRTAGQSAASYSRLDPQGAGKQAQMCGVVVSDSTWRGQGPQLTADQPIWEMRRVLSGTRPWAGTGFIPVVGGLSGTFGFGWNVAANAGAITYGNDFGPTQTAGTAGIALNSMLHLTGNATATYSVLSSIGLLPNIVGQSVTIAGEVAPGDTGWTVTANGTTIGTVGAYTSGANATFVTTLTFGSTLANPTIALTPASGGAGDLYAISINAGTTQTAAPGIMIHNLAMSSARSDAFGLAPTTQMAYVPLACPTGPDFAILALGINNNLQGNRTQSQYASDMAAIVSYLRGLNANMTILEVDENPTSIPGTTPTEAQIYATEKALALSSTPNLIFLSYKDRIGTYTNAYALGLLNPGEVGGSVHPTDKLGLLMGDQAADALFSSTQLGPAIYAATVGGTIDNTAIGSTTPSSVKATTINASGASTLQAVTATTINASGLITGTAGATVSGATITLNGTTINTGGTVNFGQNVNLATGFGLAGTATGSLSGFGQINLPAAGTLNNVGDTFHVTSSNGTVRALGFVSTPETVAFSATPTFSATTGTSRIVLTGSVTSSTLAAGLDGAMKTFQICQDATGSRTFTWPSTVHGGMTIGSTASTCSVQTFMNSIASGYAFWYATSPGVINQ